jgi:hypothetical protein
MEPTFTAAMKHLLVMETRIRQQESAIERLEKADEDTSDSMRRLNLLHKAFEEMRIQLAQLTPTEAQLSDPVWAHNLGIASGRNRRSA